MISLIWQKRAIPLYWEILEKKGKGSSNLAEQQALITPVLALFEGYEIVLLGDREFGSVKLGSWLCEKKVKFVLRIKQSRYFQEEYKDYLRLSDLGLIPGSRFFLRSIQVTKQKGFGNFNVAAYWRRKYRGKVEDEGWYLLTNLTTFQQAVTAFQARSGIEAMFKDGKTGGYNLEKSHANNQRLTALILLIAIAYTSAILQGEIIKNRGLQKYVGRIMAAKRTTRRHSSFWLGLSGRSWVIEIEGCGTIIEELMAIRRNKLPFFQRGLRAMSLILLTF